MNLRQIQDFHFSIIVIGQWLFNAFFNFSGQCFVDETIVVAVLVQEFRIINLQPSIQRIGHCEFWWTERDYDFF